MPKNQKSIRFNSLKTMKGLRPETNESTQGASYASFPELHAEALKPLLPPDSTLARLIERIKNL